MNIVQEANERLILVDGAMGTRLSDVIDRRNVCVDAYNLDQNYSEIVKTTHREYIKAGAEVILTNTYGANRLKLDHYNFGDKIEPINRKGVKIARETASSFEEPIMIGGSVGPLESWTEGETIESDQMIELFEEQIDILSEEEVDFLALETFQNLNEAQAAMKAANQTDLPVLFSIGGVRNGTTGTGIDVRRFANQMEQAGVDILGVNCRGPFDMLENLELIEDVTSLPLSVMPNAGSPEVDRGRVVYNVKPDQFRSYTRRWIEAGATILGGCCGTNPEHIREIADVIQEESLSPAERDPSSRTRVFPSDSPEQKPGVITKPANPVKDVMENEPFAISVEMRPSIKMDMEDYLGAADFLAREGLHLFDVPDNAAANVAVDPLVSAQMIQKRTHIPCMIHLGASHRNLIATQSYLLGCYQAGIHGILAVTGDHPNVGDHDKYAEHVTDIKSSVEIMELMRSMNDGKLFNDSSLNTPTNFYYGGGIAPGRNLTAQTKWLEQKVDAGANFVFSQPLYTKEQVHDYLEHTNHLDIRRFMGILPLISEKNARFIASGRIPGIEVPDHIIEKFEETPSEKQEELGIEMTLDLLDQVQEDVAGLYIIPPFGSNKWEHVKRIIQHAL